MHTIYKSILAKKGFLDVEMMAIKGVEFDDAPAEGDDDDESDFDDDDLNGEELAQELAAAKLF